MDAYDQKYVPVPFALYNNSAICHFNSLLQALASCPAAVKAVLTNKDYMERTKTGKALYAFMDTMINKDAAGIEPHSRHVIAALIDDLDTRKAKMKMKFGRSQESASEGLVYLLDMVEPPDAKEGETHPLTSVFAHRYRCNTACQECKRVRSSDLVDYAVQFNMFRNDGVIAKVDSPEKFAAVIRLYSTETEDYYCATCKKKVTAMRGFKLVMIPEIAVCLFNIYEGTRADKYIAKHMEIPSTVGPNKAMRYGLVATVEHTGSLAGGHYTARGLRCDGNFYVLDDTRVARTEPPESYGNKNTYLAFYHYMSTVSVDASLAVLRTTASLETITEDLKKVSTSDAVTHVN
ncbi:MAG: hypothetical protein KGL39_10950 [Patescibacteria group bacterium]|nr:hypothetical protein [Patescibacteria group bacterium]